MSDDFFFICDLNGGIVSDIGIEIEVSPCDLGFCNALFRFAKVCAVFSALAMDFTLPAAWRSLPCVQNSALCFEEPLSAFVCFLFVGLYYPLAIFDHVLDY